MVSQIRFLDDDHVVIYREKGFDLYVDMKQPKPSLEKTIDRTILSIADSENYIGIVTTDGARTDRRLQVITMDGEVVLDQPLDYEYADFRIYDDELYFYRLHHVDILRMNGKPKFASDFDADITGIFPGGRSIEYILVDHNSIKRIRMKAR